MFFTRRRIIIIIIIVVILLLLLLLFNNAVQKAEDIAEQQVQQTQTTQLSGSLPVEVDEVIPEPEPVISSATNPDVVAQPVVVFEPGFSDALRTGRIFAERFGSFSNQAQFQNIEDLFDLMNDSMRDWAEDMVAEGQAEAEETDEYYGINTKVISHETIEDTANNVVIKYITQRQEVGGDAGNIYYYQDIVVTLTLEDNVWKVDSAFWQDEKKEL